MSLRVRIVQLGRGIQVHEAPDGTKVGDALDACGVVTERMEVRLQGKRVERDAELHDGDLVTVIPLIKGGTTAPSLVMHCGREAAGRTR